MNTDWIKHFDPKKAYISTARVGKFLNQCTINALKKMVVKLCLAISREEHTL